MRIRDALESDAEALATAVDRPRETVINMIHDRSVRVAVSDDETRERPGGEERGSDGETERRSGSDTATVDGFIAFDVYGGAVHVTDFEGSESVVRRLFEEPCRFASREGLAVEVVVPDDEQSGSVVEGAGFEPVGSGPRFEGRPTTRYRIGPESVD